MNHEAVCRLEKTTQMTEAACHLSREKSHSKGKGKAQSKLSGVLVSFLPVLQRSFAVVLKVSAMFKTLHAWAHPPHNSCTHLGWH